VKEGRFHAKKNEEKRRERKEEFTLRSLRFFPFSSALRETFFSSF